MSPFRVAVFVVALAFMAGVRSVSPMAADSVSALTAVPDSLIRGADRSDVLDPDPDGFVVDRFGNEVDEAVCDYRVDVRGDLYERHSPETEVPRLRPPIG